MNNKDTRIGIRVTTEEKEQIIEQAEQRGLTITDYILMLIDGDFEKNS